ncbi:hypothetical protein [Virgibacillus salarius]|uniref:hypothetical protein n=1 Tax=Virgibacillus salarius TaxID=447199 RepID=UPI0031E2D238
MRCIYKEHTYYRNTECESKLIGESREGNRAPLLTGLTLTINDEGYTLTNAEGCILRQGNETDPFVIYDSMSFEVGALKLVMPGFAGVFDRYENKHGYGRVGKDIKRKFIAYTERGEGNEGAIGLIEYDRHNTLSIHSLYIPQAMTNKEHVNYLAEYIEGLLYANEYATVQAVNFTQGKIDGKYAGIVKMYGAPYKPRHEQARLLYMDAILRGTSITEVFDEPMRYEIQGLFDDADSGEGVSEIDEEKEPILT